MFQRIKNAVHFIQKYVRTLTLFLFFNEMFYGTSAKNAADIYYEWTWNFMNIS